MTCIICDKELKPVHENEFQPNDGGEVVFEFTYGSAKFDLCFGLTRFRGVVCDDCAEPLVKKMSGPVFT